MKHFKAFADYDTELLEYATVAYFECIGDLIKPIIKRGIKVAVPVLDKAKKLYGPCTSPSQTTRVELREASPTAGDG